jgi:hypothetical protein
MLFTEVVEYVFAEVRMHGFYLGISTSLFTAASILIGYASLVLAALWCVYLAVILFDWWTDRPWA